MGTVTPPNASFRASAVDVDSSWLAVGPFSPKGWNVTAEGNENVGIVIPEIPVPRNPAPLQVKCEAYKAFGNGMALDYERKFDYLEEC